jgi:hypothetical protein
LGGLIGGAVGAMIWAATARVLELEVGWIAWLSGVLVGAGVRFSAGEPSHEAGWTAAAIALLSIAAGKYAAVEMAVSDIAWADEVQITQEQAIASIAAEIVVEQGEEDDVLEKFSAFPASGATQGEDQPELEQLFPPDIWRMARLRWEALSPEGQREKVAEIQEALLKAQDAIKGVVRREGFLASFSAYDLLWAVLAIGTAFKIAMVPSSNGPSV